MLVVAPDAESNPLAQTLGGRIRVARQAAGLTTRGLAQLCGLSQPFVSQMENGQAMPSVVTLLRLAEALGTTLQWILDDGAQAPVSLVRAGTGRRYQVADSLRASARVLVDGQQGFEALEFTASPGEVMGPHVGHGGTDFVHVIDGDLLIDLEGDDCYRVGPGDSLSYPAEIPHQWTAGDVGTVRFVCVVIAGQGPPFEGHRPRDG